MLPTPVVFRPMEGNCIVWHTGQDAVIMAKRIGTSTIYMEALGSSDPGGP